MREASRNTDVKSMIWETLPETHRDRIARVLALAIAEMLRVPVEQDDDGPGRCTDGPG